MKAAEVLKGYEGKIVVVKGTEKKDGKVIIPRWTKEREKHLYNGKITNQNLREKLPEELDMEFDHNADVEYKAARKEAETWTDKIKEVLLKQDIHFYITDHKGKSPHTRIFIRGLDHYPLKYSLEYKLRLAENILKEINFKSKLVHLDEGLITSVKKLISLEDAPHWKEKWNGEPEKTVFINEEGKKPEVKKNVMDNIINDLSQSQKEDKKIILDPIDVKEVNIEGLNNLFKRYYKEGYRNNLLISFSGICVKKGISLEDTKKILKTILNNIGCIADFDKFAETKISYASEIEKKEDVAVYYHLKQVFVGEELYKVYGLLNRCFLRKEDIEYKNTTLSKLNATFIGKKVSIDCQITGEQSQKAIPKTIMVKCQTCNDTQLYDSSDTPEIFCGERQIKTILKELKDKKMCQCIVNNMDPDNEDKQKPHKTTKILGYVDHAVLFVRDLLKHEDQFVQTNYDPKRIYVVGAELPKTKIINVKGKVIIEEKTKNISIVADAVEPLKNQVEDFRITEEIKKEWKEYFNDDTDLPEEINPDIVGQKRKIAKKCLIAQLHSPCQIYDIERKKIIKGAVNVIFYGDTKVGKSEIAKDVTSKRYYELGEYSVVETGGRTGFLYTIDNDRGALIWGSLPLNDMGLLVLDGLQCIPSNEMGEFREALELQEVIVNRSIKGSALARTRVIGCLNPNKPMNQYIYKCEALTDNYVFSKTPELTRWDLYVSFCHNDVTSKEIADRTSKDRKIPKQVFINHIYWVWSRKPGQIEYTDSAVTTIKENSQQLNDKYSIERLPIVHNGIRDIVTRLAVSKAAELHSTDETNEKIIVEKDHVTKAVAFYEEVLQLIELDKYKAEVEGKSELSDNNAIAIAKDLNKTEYDILEQIKIESKTSIQLAAVMDVSDRTIKEHYIPLKKHGLIDAVPGKGVGLSVKGIKFVRWGLHNPSEVVKENFTSENPVKKNFTTSLDKYIGGSEKTSINEAILSAIPAPSGKKEDPQDILYAKLKDTLLDQGLFFNDIAIDKKLKDILNNFLEAGDILETEPGKYQKVIK